jgi:YVTN family beta-propeller protein
MSNVIRTLLVSELFAAEWPPQRRLYYLGQPDRATGDPTALVMTRDGRQIVSYAGLGELGVSDSGANYFRTVAVGLRPTALALTMDEKQVLVANTLGDSVSVIDIATCERVAEIVLGPRPAPSQAELGERLFYDARLSSDGWFSCHACHTEGHTNGHLSDNLGDGSFGAPKRVLSLAGTGVTGPWAWDGGVAELADQVRKSIESTMQGPAPTDEQVAQLTAFLQGIPPVPGRRSTRVGSAADAAPEVLARGAAIFQRQGCVDCHVPPTYTSPAKFDVGVADEVGNAAFNPPSLRGVSQHFRLFHDNRAEGLRDLLGRLRHGSAQNLSHQELEDLILYVESL